LAHARRYVYPDLSVVCGSVVVRDDDVMTNPTVVIEVLLSGTEQYDRGSRWDGYQSLSSATDYVLVSPHRAHIEHFSRTPDHEWRYVTANSGERVFSEDVTFGGASVAVVFDLRGPGGRLILSSISILPSIGGNVP
jgi:Uma2 family endonuclease